MVKSLSHQKIAHILSLTRAGYRAATIADRVGVSIHTIYKYWRRHGYGSGKPSPRPTVDQRLEAVRRYASGEPVEDIAAGAGVTVNTVYKWASVEGIGRRAELSPTKLLALALFAEGVSIDECARAVGEAPHLIKDWVVECSNQCGGEGPPRVEDWRRVERLGEDETWIHTSGARVTITDRGPGAAPGRWRTLEPWIDQAFPTRAEALNGVLGEGGARWGSR